MNEVLLDQIPNLTQMLRVLEELSIQQVGTNLQNMNGFIVQQVNNGFILPGHSNDL